MGLGVGFLSSVLPRVSRGTSQSGVCQSTGYVFVAVLTRWHEAYFLNLHGYKRGSSVLSMQTPG